MCLTPIYIYRGREGDRDPLERIDYLTLISIYRGRERDREGRRMRE
jgi:hypothetical protein